MVQSLFDIQKRYHYGWFIVVAGCLCIFGCLGLGRFALGMLLPAMGSSLELSYSQMGLISTCNFFGYLFAVLACGRVQSIVGARVLISAALLLISLSMVVIGFARSLPVIMILYTLTGIGSGAANVPMMGLISTWFSSSIRGRAAGFIVIGSGFAILMSGQLVPFLNALRPDGWRLSWLVLGLIVLAITLFCWFVLRDSPENRGMAMVGAEEDSSRAGSGVMFGPLNRNIVLYCGAIYFVFGFTYVIYATFIVTVLVQEYGFSEQIAGTFWSWVGLLSFFSGPVFGTLSDKVGRKTGLIVVFLIQTAAYLLVGFKLPGIALALSIGCFGIVAWSIPSIMLALVGDMVGPYHTVRAFGLITFIFGIGQILGPYIAGLLAERTGDFSSAFLLAAGMTATAAILSWRLRGKNV